MSTLQVTNIKATGETASRAVSGVAAAWADYSATAVIYKSLNIASSTDVSAGTYDFTYINNFDGIRYASATDQDNFNGYASTNNKTASGNRQIISRDSSVSPEDLSDGSFILFGDLA